MSQQGDPLLAPLPIHHAQEGQEFQLDFWRSCSPCAGLVASSGTPLAEVPIGIWENVANRFTGAFLPYATRCSSFCDGGEHATNQ